MIDLGNMKGNGYLEAITFTWGTWNPEKCAYHDYFFNVWRIVCWKKVCVCSVCSPNETFPILSCTHWGFSHEASVMPNPWVSLNRTELALWPSPPGFWDVRLGVMCGIYQGPNLRSVWGITCYCYWKMEKTPRSLWVSIVFSFHKYQPDMSMEQIPATETRESGEVKLCEGWECLTGSWVVNTWPMYDELCWIKGFAGMSLVKDLMWYLRRHIRCSSGKSAYSQQGSKG